MEEHKCKRCGYETCYKQNLIAHLKRKNICKAIYEDISIDIILKDYEKNYNDNSFQCTKCLKPFTSNSNRCRHQKICNKNVNVLEVNKLKDVVTQLQEKVNELNNQVIIQNSENITNNNVQHNNTITINLRSFGFENIKHLESDKDYMTKCLLNKDVIKLLENIHCDVEYPENTNVKIKSTKRELMETFIDGHWMISDQEETLDELINKGYRILNFFRHRNKDHILKECEDGEGEYNEMIDWLEDLYSNTKTRQPLKRKMLILFMNNKTYFLNKEEIKKEESIKNIVIQKIDDKQEENIIIQDEENNDDDSVISDRSYEPEEMSPEEAAKYTQSVWNPNKNIR